MDLTIAVDGGVLHAVRFGSGSRVVLAAHGITASAMAFRAVAAALPAEWSLVALDLRGRGHSAALPGPFGLDRHAADVCAAAEQLGAGAPLVLAGHSMGAYVALRAVARRPDLFTRVVLIDGGLPLPLPPEADPDQVLDATLGPAIARLRRSFPSVEAYLDFFRAHPALAAAWSADLDDYVRYDVAASADGYRSRVNERAVREDGRDLLVNGDRVGADLEGLARPARLLYAPRGMFGQPPGLLPEPLVTAWRARAPRLGVELVADTNHYTILFAGAAARTLAERLVAGAAD